MPIWQLEDAQCAAVVTLLSALQMISSWVILAREDALVLPHSGLCFFSGPC